MIEGMPSLDRAREDEVPPEREEVIREAMARGRILTTKVMEERHHPNDLSAMLENVIGEETDAEAAVHMLIQCIYTTAGLLHLLGHLIPDEAEAMMDKYVELAGMAETVESKGAMEHLMADLLKEAGHGE
jgi:hypothetical protein